MLSIQRQSWMEIVYSSGNNRSWHAKLGDHGKSTQTFTRFGLKCFCQYKATGENDGTDASYLSGSVLNNVTLIPPCATGAVVGRKGRPVALASQLSFVMSPRRQPAKRVRSVSPSAR